MYHLIMKTFSELQKHELFLSKRLDKMRSKGHENTKHFKITEFIFLAVQGALKRLSLEKGSEKASKTPPSGLKFEDLFKKNPALVKQFYSKSAGQAGRFYRKIKKSYGIKTPAV